MDQDRLIERNWMVDRQIVPRGIREGAVIAAMRHVPRHRFIPETHQAEAYGDHPITIGYGQTISQPYIVALMTEALHLTGREKILEIGTGSGYQTAILAELGHEVWTMEIVEVLGHQARATLSALGYGNVKIRLGDGYQGWPDKAPFDAIILTAAPDHLPDALVKQLAGDGRIILPMGTVSQHLVLIRRTENGIDRQDLIPVAFVPMTGEAKNSGRKVQPS